MVQNEPLESRLLLAGVVDAATLAWSMYIGGSQNDSAEIAVDRAGSVLVAGTTGSSDVAGASNSYYGAGADALLGKFDANGTMQWLMYLGGSGVDDMFSVAVDNAGNAIVVGSTSSTDYVGANNSYHGGTTDVFVAKVSPSGALLWSTYLGGSSDSGIALSDAPFAVAVDSAGDVLVVGDTWTRDFSGATPVSGPGGSFIAKVSGSGTLLWATYFAQQKASIQDVALDDADHIFVAGKTGSPDLPNATNGNHIHDSILGRVGDGFVARLDDFGEVLWATYVGGSESDVIAGIAIDRFGDAVVVGRTFSSDLERAGNSYGGGLYDGFAAKVTGSGTLLWSTYVGGTDEDTVRDVAVDSAGNAWVTGETRSADLGFLGTALQGEGLDAFAVKISGAGRQVWGRYIGGSGGELGMSIELGPRGEVWVSGNTASTDFVGVSDAYRGGVSDAFVAKLVMRTAVTGTSGDDRIDVATAMVADAASGQTMPGLQVTINGVAEEAFVPAGQVVIYGLGANDRIVVDPDVTLPVLIYGGGGNDTIFGGAGNDTLRGGLGDDWIVAGEGNNSVMGGLGDDTLFGGGMADTLLGGDGFDLIYGNGGDDWIEGRGKADTIDGGGGNDTIYGGAGSDLILGGEGDDHIDVAVSAVFHDSVDGGNGNDSSDGDANDILTSIENVLA